MKYQKMRILSYGNYHEINEEYERRLNSYSTEKTDLGIHPFNLEERMSDIYPLFYIYRSDIEIKKNDIFKNS